MKHELKFPREDESGFTYFIKKPGQFKSDFSVRECQKRKKTMLHSKMLEAAQIGCQIIIIIFNSIVWTQKPILILAVFSIPSTDCWYCPYNLA